MSRISDFMQEFDAMTSRFEEQEREKLKARRSMMIARAETKSFPILANNQKALSPPEQRALAIAGHKLYNRGSVALEDVAEKLKVSIRTLTGALRKFTPSGSISEISRPRGTPPPKLARSGTAYSAAQQREMAHRIQQEMYDNPKEPFFAICYRLYGLHNQTATGFFKRQKIPLDKGACANKQYSRRDRWDMDPQTLAKIKGMRSQNPPVHWPVIEKEIGRSLDLIKSRLKESGNWPLTKNDGLQRAARA